MAERILVVEDEPSMVVGLRDGLTAEGYRVSTARDGQEGLGAALAGHPDLVILDVMMPRKNGFEVCRELRQKGFSAPIILLTAKGDEVDKVTGLGAGADDYLTKPFGFGELVARIKALLRRGPLKPPGVSRVQIGPWTVDFDQYLLIHAKGRRLALTPRERDLLHYLVGHEGIVLSRDCLLTEVWGPEVSPTTKVVDIHIYKLRQKIEERPDRPEYLMGVHGAGYKFVSFKK